MNKDNKAIKLNTSKHYYVVEFKAITMIESPVELTYHEAVVKGYESLEVDDYEVVEVMKTDDEGWVQEWLKKGG